MASKPRKPRTSCRADRSDDWKKAVIEKTLHDISHLQPEAREQIEESLRTQLSYQGEYIAYVDSWTLRNGVKRFSRRVVAHSKAEQVVCRAVNKLPPEERAKVVLDYEPDFYITSNDDC